MGILGSILSEVTASGITSIFGGIGQLAKDVREVITGELSPEKKANVLNKVLEMEALARNGQLEINRQEAGHRSIFVAGARPAILWIAAISLACYFIPQYLMAAVLWTRVCWTTQHIVEFPITEPAGLLELVFTLLGIGTLRTIEKLKGVTY